MELERGDYCGRLDGMDQQDYERFLSVLRGCTGSEQMKNENRDNRLTSITEFLAQLWSIFTEQVPIS